MSGCERSRGRFREKQLRHREETGKERKSSRSRAKGWRIVVGRGGGRRKTEKGGEPCWTQAEEGGSGD